MSDLAYSTGAIIAAAFLVHLSTALPAAAQNLDRGKSLWQEKANCAFCHGWAGDGQGDPRSEGAGTSVRAAGHLDLETVYEIIQCGRPGTGMPYHDRFAYSDDRCYGLTKEDLGDQIPRFGSKGLQKNEIQLLAEYVMAKVIGQGPVTRAQCEEFYGRSVQTCEKYD